jgi:hypothetical protein
MRRFREPAAPAGPTGWMIGVMVRLAGQPAPVRQFFAVAQDDLALAEWAAVDLAVAAGDVASSPVGGVEPVESVGRLSADVIGDAGMAAGQVRALGSKWPRRWLRG